MVDSGTARPPLLALHGVRVRARGAVLIDGFDMDLFSGEALALVGPSGCGKSLLLRIAAGLDQPDCGERRAGDSRAAFVFQEGGLVRNVTVAENLRLPLYYKGLGYGAARAAASAALDAFGLTAVGDERPSALLNETRLLVQFARAAAMDADLLFLDEPFPQLSRPALARVEQWLASELEKGKLAIMMSAVEPQSLPPISARIRELGPPAAVVAKGAPA